MVFDWLNTIPGPQTLGCKESTATAAGETHRVPNGQQLLFESLLKLQWHFAHAQERLSMASSGPSVVSSRGTTRPN